MKVLVIGGSGYLGRILLKNLKSGSIRNADIALINADDTFLDINDKRNIKDVLEQHSPDVIIHLAALSNITLAESNPMGCIRTNIIGTRNILDKMEELRIPRIIFASSAAVYGNHSGEVTESAPLVPESIYGTSKLSGEKLLENYNVQSIALRIFNLAGADIVNNLGENHDPESHLIPNLVQSKLKNKEVYIYGTTHPTKDGTCVRDYIHVLDVVSAVQAILDTSWPYMHDCFNIGSGEGHSVLDIVNHLGFATDHIKIREKRPGDVPKLVPVIDKIKAHFGWSPTYTLSRIVTDVMEYEKRKELGTVGDENSRHYSCGEQ